MDFPRPSLLADGRQAGSNTLYRGFPQLDATERNRLLELSRVERIMPATPVVRPGETVLSLLQVVEGFFLTRREGVVNDVLIPGEMVGLAEFVLGSPCDYVVEAPRPAAMLVIPRSAMRELQAGATTIWRTLARHLAERTTRLERDQDALASADALESVAWRLYELSTRWRAVFDVKQFGIPITQEELGTWAGVSRESTVKALRVLRSRGLVQTGRRQLRVLDPEGLRKLIRRRLHVGEGNRRGNDS